MQPSPTSTQRRRLLRPAALALAAAALLAAGTARAAVSTSALPDVDGSFAGIAYGNTGNVFELVVTSRRNPAMRSRHIPASRRGAEVHLEALF